MDVLSMVVVGIVDKEKPVEELDIAYLGFPWEERIKYIFKNGLFNKKQKNIYK